MIDYFRHDVSGLLLYVVVHFLMEMSGIFRLIIIDVNLEELVEILEVRLFD